MTEQNTEQDTKMLNQRPSNVWINHEGKFLVVSEGTTHTGHHIRGSFTDNLHDAFVGYKLPRFTEHEMRNMELIAIPAWAERKVTIGIKPEWVTVGEAK